ncbi:MAG TPA: acetate--CoA ligase family protein, partial [Stellaceae bacterium]|nr:acetate--CoA ligase family protein [Stellaceae bacterium]
LCITCLSTLEFRKTLQAAGVLSFEEPVHAVRAVAALAAFRRSFDAAAQDEEADREVPLDIPHRAEIAGLEMMIEGRGDPAFGALISLRFGGVLGEILGRAVLRAAPITLEEAAAMIEELLGRTALTPASAVETQALARTLVLASRSLG